MMKRDEIDEIDERHIHGRSFHMLRPMEKMIMDSQFGHCG
jgi:3-oxoacyl-(acyl-carrier-protein) synthase